LNECGGSQNYRRTLGVCEGQGCTNCSVELRVTQLTPKAESGLISGAVLMLDRAGRRGCEQGRARVPVWACVAASRGVPVCLCGRAWLRAGACLCACVGVRGCEQGRACVPAVRCACGQILMTGGDGSEGGARVSSLVLVRGSVPLLWQVPQCVCVLERESE
jgi:hypothetical protein